MLQVDSSRNRSFTVDVVQGQVLPAKVNSIVPAMAELYKKKGGRRCRAVATAAGACPDDDPKCGWNHKSKPMVIYI